ncbi:MAG: Gfo/Idh/MocA family protein [Thermoguttaceae bacterium]
MNRRETSRRDFLKRSAGLAAVGAIPYFWTSRCARADGSKAEKLTMAAIGVGGRGTEIGNQAASLANVVACVDVKRGNAERFAGPLGGKCKIYTDYRKVLDRKDIQAITCATPDHWHTKIAVEAMRAGKDVYCEKPLTLTIAEGKLIANVVRETRRVFQVGTQQRSEYDGAFLEAVAIVRGGRLGKKLKAIARVEKAKRGGPFPPEATPADLNWDFWLGQAPEAPYTKKRWAYDFRYWFEYSGGEVTDWGVHHTDIALWALGAEETGPVEVEGKGDFPLGRKLMLETLLGKKPFAALPPSYNVPTTYNCTMTLPGGNSIVLTNGDYELYFEGERGYFAVRRSGLRGKFIEKLKKDPAQKKWLAEEVKKLYKGKPIRGHMANFLDCVKDRSLPISDVFTHVNTVNACHMANIAMLLGHKVRWDLKAQQFVGDADANALMSRRQREPYTITA